VQLIGSDVIVKDKIDPRTSHDSQRELSIALLFL